MIALLQITQKYLILVTRLIALAYVVWALWIVWSIVYQPLQLDTTSVTTTQSGPYTIPEAELKLTTEHVAQRQALADDFSTLTNPFQPVLATVEVTSPPATNDNSTDNLPPLPGS